MPQRWGGLKDRRASLVDRARKRRRISDDLCLGNDDTGAADEGTKQFESRDVETNRRYGHQPIIAGKTNLFPHRQEDVLKAAMGDGDALGRSGRA
ncbi:MAG TPA: hypothetical protein VFO15_00825 [Xanthobacteraceae bacterium]|nr:hypothetical protein [Xanthobacteraceae bacterium]